MLTCTRRVLLLIALASLAGGCQWFQASRVEAPDEAAKKQANNARSAPDRIILMIGDGMGVPAITAGSYAKGKRLQMTRLPELGFMTTHSSEYLTTDSAASATAMATGDKTHFEGISVVPGTTAKRETEPGTHLETLVEKAEKQGLKTGLVATARIVHATPAAFASHRANRHSYRAIARDMANSGLDVMMGAGSQYFEGQKDESNLLDKLRDRGLEITESADATRRAASKADKLAAFLHPKDMPPVVSDNERKLSLASMTGHAIDVLDRKNPNGFFLMVEGSQIDWEEHDLDGRATAAETVDFDEAVKTAMDYAATREDTLVVVTADHETGGLAVTSPGLAEKYVDRLGGLDRARQKLGTAKLKKSESKSEAQTPDLVPHPAEFLELGTGHPASRTDAVDDEFEFGPSRAKDYRFATTFGYLSQASWKHRKPGQSFYAAHTSSMVPIFASGPTSDYVADARDNAELGKRLARAIDSKASDSDRSPSNNKKGANPQNTILIVAEGMGLGATTIAHYAKGPLAMRSMPTRGLAATHSVDSMVPDNRAAFTALSTGHRTENRVLGMSPHADGLHNRPGLLERAEKSGQKTGIITTHSLAHSGPGSLFAHGTKCTPSKKPCWTDQFFADAFVTLSDRVKGADGIDLVASTGPSIFSKKHREELSGQGYRFASSWTPEQAQEDSSKLLLRQPSAPNPDGLRETVKNTVERLSSESNGFTLVVNLGKTGEMQRQMARDSKLIAPFSAVDAVVTEALSFAETNGQTSVVVTAQRNHTTSATDNHYAFAKQMCGIAARCGGPQQLSSIRIEKPQVPYADDLDNVDLQGEAYHPPELIPQYAWLGQIQPSAPGLPAATFVPVWAFGPGTPALEGVYHQEQIGKQLHKWLK